MPTPNPKEPMDTYLCVLLDLSLINASSSYTQARICEIIADNQSSFDAIYNDPNEVTRVRIEFLETAQLIDLWDKDEDCA